MKKFLSLFLVLMLVCSLSGCVIDSSKEFKNSSDVSQSEENPQSTPESDNSTDSDPAPSSTPKDNPAESTNNDTSEAATKDTTVAETVILDDHDIKVTVKGLSKDSFMGPSLKMLIENNSEKTLTFQARNASVNGYMVETAMSADVAPGKKINDELIFMNSDLEMAGISDIADMEFSLHVFDSDSWDDYVDTDLISIKTSIADGYNYVYDDTGEIVYDDGSIKLIVKGLTESDSVFGSGITMYIENNSNSDFTIQTRDVSVNGYMIDTSFSSDVLVGKHCVDTIIFFSSDLEENEITEIKDVELSFHIFDLESWDTIVDTDLIKFSFE